MSTKFCKASGTISDGTWTPWSAPGQNETSALVLASAASTPKPDIAVAGEKGLTSRLGLQKGLLPIDAKFPHDSFERVVAAAEAGNPAEDFLLAPKFT